MSRKSCEDVRDALLAGRGGDEPAVLSHAEGCEQCATLLLDRASLGQAFAEEPAALAADGALWTELERSVRADTGVRAWLSSRSTPARIACALVAALGVVLLGLLHVRPDFASVPLPVVIGWLLAFSVAATAVVTLALRELGRPEASSSSRRRRLLAALVVPTAYALSAGATFDRTPVALGSAWAAQTLGCFVYGLLLGSPLVALLWLLDRGAGPRSRVLAGAAAAGIAANGALLLHCGASDPGHLMLGHVAIGVALALGGWWLASRQRRNATPSSAARIGG